MSKILNTCNIAKEEEAQEHVKLEKETCSTSQLPMRVENLQMQLNKYFMVLLTYLGILNHC